MAENEITTVAPGVTRTELDWGYLIQGRKEALLFAGVIQESWLQDGTVRNKRGHAVRSKEFTVNGRRIKTSVTNAKRQSVTVWMDFTEAELAARVNAEAAAEAAKAATEAQRYIDAMPKNAQGYRQHIIRLVESFISAATLHASDTKFYGYRLHPETIAELERLAGHMENAIEIGEVVFDRKARYAAELRVRVEAAKADPAVQNFMKRVTGDQGVSE